MVHNGRSVVKARIAAPFSVNIGVSAIACQPRIPESAQLAGSLLALRIALWTRQYAISHMQAFGRRTVTAGSRDAY